MNRFRWIFVAVLIVATVGAVIAQHQQKTPSMEQRVTKLELQVEALIDMHMDVMKIKNDKYYERNLKRRMEEFRRTISAIPMRVRSKMEN